MYGGYTEGMLVVYFIQGFGIIKWVGLCSTQTQGVGYSLICLRGILELVSLRVFRMQTSIFLAIKKKKTVGLHFKK